MDDFDYQCLIENASSYIPISKDDVAFLKMENVSESTYVLDLLKQIFTFIYYSGSGENNNMVERMYRIHYYPPLMILFAKILKIPANDNDDVVVPICLDFPQGGKLYSYDSDYSITQYLCRYKKKLFPKVVWDMNQQRCLFTCNDRFVMEFSTETVCTFLVIYLSNDDIISSIKIDDEEHSFFTIEFFNKILYVVSFVHNEFKEYINDLDDLYEIFAGDENSYFKNTLHYIKHIPHNRSRLVVDVSTLSSGNNKVYKYCNYC